MKKIFFVVILLSAAIQGFSQVKEPVKWDYTSKKIDESTFEISLTANVDPSWHIYSQTTPEGGPSATVISFSKNPMIQLDGR